MQNPFGFHYLSVTVLSGIPGYLVERDCYISREQLAVRNVLDFRPGLLAAQCRQLGTWLREGGPLAGVARLENGI